MKLMDWINKVTKLNQTTMTEFQNNIESGKQDKMEEGTWTPVLTTVEGKAPTMEYSGRVGKFKKIGNLCFVSFYISGKITALNGTDNYGIITGIPYRPSVTFGQNAISTGVCYNLTETENVVQLLLSPNENGIRLQTNRGSYSCKLKVTPSSAPAYFQIAGSGWYETY